MCVFSVPAYRSGKVKDSDGDQPVGCLRSGPQAACYVRLCICLVVEKLYTVLFFSVPSEFSHRSRASGLRFQDKVFGEETLYFNRSSSQRLHRDKGCSKWLWPLQLSLASGCVAPDCRAAVSKSQLALS